MVLDNLGFGAVATGDNLGGKIGVKCIFLGVIGRGTALWNVGASGRWHG